MFAARRRPFPTPVGLCPPSPGNAQKTKTQNQTSAWTAPSVIQKSEPSRLSQPPSLVESHLAVLKLLLAALSMHRQENLPRKCRCQNFTLMSADTKSK